MAEIIPHWLSKQADLAPNHLALEFPDGEEITFRKLQLNSESYAKRLATLGVKPGMRIGILSSNELEMVYTIHALSYLGAIGVLLNTRLTDEEIQYQLQNAEVSLLITDNKEKKRCLKIKGQYRFFDLQTIAEADIELVQELNLDDIFTIIYTSGTTGFPKGVMHTYGNHWWNAISSALNLGIDKADKWLISLPLFHVSGLSTLMKSVIYGMPIYLMEKFDEKQVHEAILKKDITIVSVVTVMIQRLMEKMGNERYPEKLRCFLLGGGPAPQALLERAKEKAIPVFQSYGMTETASQIAALNPNDALNKLGSAGKPLFPAQLKIEKPGMDGIGEIVVKGPTVTMGYYNNSKANKESISEGWFKTGDLGYIDQDGYLYVVDRRTDLIISGGENIYPTEIENALMKMPEVKEAGVTKMEDEIWGQIPVAYVVTNKKVTEIEILSFLKQHLAAYKLPKKVYFIDQLPRNVANKLVRNKLQNIR